MDFARKTSGIDLQRCGIHFQKVVRNMFDLTCKVRRLTSEILTCRWIADADAGHGYSKF